MTKLDGLISFFASHYAVRAEAVLQRAGYQVLLIPGPKELSPNCGVALRFEYVLCPEILALLAEKRVKIDEVHPYRPQHEHAPRPPDSAVGQCEQSEVGRRKWSWLTR